MQSLTCRVIMLTILSLSTVAGAQTLEEGDRCTLYKKAALKFKRGKKWIRKVLPVSTEVIVIERAKRFVKVKSDQYEGFIKARRLDTVCELVEVEEPEPEQPKGIPEDTAPPPAPEPSVQVAVEKKTGADTPSEESAFGKTYKIKVLVMDLKGSKNVQPQLLSSLGGAIAEELDGLGPFKAISSQDVGQMLSHEANQMLVGCNETSCMSEIGGALGADFLVTGNLTIANNMYIIQLQLINAREARVDARTSREHEGKSKGLFGHVRVMTKILVRDILSRRLGKLALEISEEGATVKVDGTIRGVSPIEPLAISSGTHTISVEKEGFVLSRQDATIVEDKVTTLSFRLLPSAEFKRRYTRKAKNIRVGAWISFGVGVAALAGAGTIYGLARGKTSDLNADIRAYNSNEVRTTEEFERLGKLESEIGTLDTVSVAAGAVGLAGLVVATILWIAGDNPDRYDSLTSEHQEGIQPLLAPSALGMQGRF